MRPLWMSLIATAMIVLIASCGGATDEGPDIIQDSASGEDTTNKVSDSDGATPSDNGNGVALEENTLGDADVNDETQGFTEEQRKQTEERMESIQTALMQIAVTMSKKRALRRPELAEAEGPEFLVEAVKQGLIDAAVVASFVLPDGDETAAQPIKNPAVENVSFCVPRGENLLRAMAGRGSRQAVIVCPLGKYWEKFGGKVPIVSSDRARVRWVALEDLADWDITEDEWADPSGKLFGKKAPFHYVYE